MLKQIKETEELIAEIRHRCGEIMEVTDDVRIRSHCRVLLNHAHQKEESIEGYFRGLDEFVDESSLKS